MSKLFGSLASKLIGLLVIVMFVIGFKESILTDANISNAFGGLMEALPFSNIIVENICRIMKFNYELPSVTVASVGTDIMKLLIMACIQPLFVSLLSMMFLRMPSSLGIDAAESFMSRPGYRIKEMIITIVTAPLLAVIAAWLTTWVFDFFASTFNDVVAAILKFLSVILVGGISLTPLLITGTAVGTAVAWRLLVTVGAKVVGTFVTNAICLWIYIALIGGVSSQVFSSILSLVIWLFVMDFGIKCLQRAVVG